MKAYLLRVCIAADQLLQAMFRYGKPGVTISARVGTAAAHDKKWGLLCARMLNVLGRDHCKLAVLNDIQRARDAIKELREPAVRRWTRRK
jgi:hypothetical protein